MSDQQPSVSSIRVDKPGKAKFAPVIGGDRKKATAAAAPVVAPLATPVPVNRAESVIERFLEPSLLITEEETIHEGIEEDKAKIASPKATVKTATSIQTVQSRRAAAAPKASPAAPSKKAATTAAELTEQAKAPVVKSLSYYTRDRKEGIPMASSTSATRDKAAGTASGRSTPAPSNIPSRSVSTVIAPQVRIVGGEIVVDEETTVMTQEDPKEALHLEIVQDTGRHLTSHAFVKHGGANRWNAEDTQRFYEAVSMCGTDFSLMSLLFPNKTREQIKSKYRLEERSNPKRLEIFLRKRVKFDVHLMNKIKADREAAAADSDEQKVVNAETKRGRPKQEFEGSPGPIPSIISTPSRRSSLASAPSGSTSPKTKKQKARAVNPVVDEEEDSKTPASSPLKEVSFPRRRINPASVLSSPRTSPRRAKAQ